MKSPAVKRPVMVVVAGPPGSGKSVMFPVARTGFDHFCFHERCFDLNARFRTAVPAPLRKRVKREYARFVSAHLRERRSFAVESNLVEDDTLRHARVARRRGFITRLIVLRTDDVEELLHRVRKRGLGGGVSLPPGRVAELYRDSLMKLDDARAVFDSVTVFENAHRPSPTTSRPRGERAHAHLTEGLTAIESGRWEDAVDAFRQAIHLDRDHAGAYYHLGLAYERLGNWHLARHVFFELTRIRPDDPEAHLQLGMACVEIRAWDEAVEAFLNVVRLRPNDSEALQRLGVCYNETDQPDMAVPYLLRAISAKLAELYPSDATAQFRLALACGDLDASPQAHKAFPEARRIQADDESSLNAEDAV